MRATYSKFLVSVLLLAAMVIACPTAQASLMVEARVSPDTVGYVDDQHANVGPGQDVILDIYGQVNASTSGAIAQVPIGLYQTNAASGVKVRGNFTGVSTFDISKFNTNQPGTPVDWNLPKNGTTNFIPALVTDTDMELGPNIFNTAGSNLSKYWAAGTDSGSGVPVTLGAWMKLGTTVYHVKTAVASGDDTLLQVRVPSTVAGLGNWFENGIALDCTTGTMSAGRAVDLNVVPEPSTLVLLLGACGVALCLWRKRS